MRMTRNYVGGDGVRFTRAGTCLVDMEYYGGETVKRLEPHRLFPISGGDRYITLLDEDGIERAIIRDLSTLLPESQAVIREALAEYYLIPKITRVNDATERYGIKWWVETDRGPRRRPAPSNAGQPTRSCRLSIYSFPAR